MKLPAGATEADGVVRNSRGERIEIFEGKWCIVVDGSRLGWWRFNEHYDRNGYCDNPARGY